MEAGNSFPRLVSFRVIFHWTMIMGGGTQTAFPEQLWLGDDPFLWGDTWRIIAVSKYIVSATSIYKPQMDTNARGLQPDL